MQDCDKETKNSTKVLDEKIKIKQLFIVGEINEDRSREIIKALFETNWEKEEITNIHLYITSEGGYLKDCFAIIDAILFVKEAFNIHVSTFGLGECASAGFFIFLVGDMRVLFPRCNVFVHEHITQFSENTYSDSKKEEKDATMLYDMYVKYTCDRLQLSKARVRTLLKKNRYLRFNELESFNIITKEE